MHLIVSGINMSVAFNLEHRVAHLDGIRPGVSQFYFILGQLNGSGLDWAFHCSAHEIQRVQEY